MPESLNYIPPDAYKGDFNDVHEPEFQKELRQDEQKHEDLGEEQFDNGLGVLLKRKTLFHGSGISGIESFNPAEETTVGEGVYFTSDPNSAAGYAQRRSRRSKEDKPVVYEASVENMRLVDLRKKDNVRIILDGFKEILLEKSKDDSLRWDLKGILSNALEAINSDKVGSGNLREVAFSMGIDFTKYLESLGYDGLITFEGGEGNDIGYHDTYLIFDPNKVKILKETKTI
jgi:hypothetical protein